MKYVKALCLALATPLLAQLSPFVLEGGQFYVRQDEKLLVQKRPGFWSRAPLPYPERPSVFPNYSQSIFFDGRQLFQVGDTAAGTRCVVVGRVVLEQGKARWEMDEPIPIPEKTRLVAAAGDRLYLRRDHWSSKPSAMTTPETKVELMRFDLLHRTTERLEEHAILPMFLNYHAIVLDGDVCLFSSLGKITLFNGTTGALRVLCDDFIARLPWTPLRGIHGIGPSGHRMEYNPMFTSEIFPDHEGNLCLGLSSIEMVPHSSQTLLEQLSKADESRQLAFARMGFTPDRLRARDKWELPKPRVDVIVFNPVTKSIKPLPRESYEHLLKEVEQPAGLTYTTFKTANGRNSFFVPLYMDAKEKLQWLDHLGEAAPPPKDKAGSKEPTPEELEKAFLKQTAEIQAEEKARQEKKTQATP